MKDTYSDFQELSKNEQEGIDYEIICKSSNSPVLIIAPHGGDIEKYTDILASEIAGNKFSLYCFNGLKSSGNRKLHISSKHFDEPRVLNMLKQSNTIVSIHGERAKKRHS
jgi:phage replication-related protein YjqB (UPF0714/DUF867 family)